MFWRQLHWRAFFTGCHLPLDPNRTMGLEKQFYLILLIRILYE